MQNLEKTLGSIREFIEKKPEFEAYQDYFDVLRSLGEADGVDAINSDGKTLAEIRPNKAKSYEHNLWLRGEASKHVMRESNPALIEKFYDLSKKTYLYPARDDFDSYCLYLEWNRDPKKRFFQPRRRVLRPLVQDLQDLADRKIDFLGVSLPTRTGKSTLCILFMTWLMGKNPDVANVMSGHSDKLTDGFYREAFSILTDGTTYLWKDVFPDVRLVDNSAKNETIDLNRKKRFPTFTARSIGGTLTGAVEIGEGGCLYVDDLVEDLEESLNPTRLESKYNAYLNQLKDRKKEGAFELMVGTRWNPLDPLGRIQDQYGDDPRHRFRVIPALNEKDESNFVYDYGLGFSTEYYHKMRNDIDTHTWLAKYQGSPRVREGLLFPSEELQYFNGVLPDGEHYKFAVCDVAWGGGDNLCMGFFTVCGDAVYLTDVIHNQGDKTITQPLVVGYTKQHMPHEQQYEANNGGAEYADAIDQLLRKDGVRINISSKRAPNNQSKMGRIIQHLPDIKKFYFLKSGTDENGKSYRSEEYQKFMDEVTTFTQMGKNPHDDGCDMLAMAAAKLYGGSGTARVEIGRRQW